MQEDLQGILQEAVLSQSLFSFTASRRLHGPDNSNQAARLEVVFRLVWTHLWVADSQP